MASILLFGLVPAHGCSPKCMSRLKHGFDANVCVSLSWNWRHMTDNGARVRTYVNVCQPQGRRIA